MSNEVFIPMVIFFGMYYIIKLISEHLLRRKLIKAGQYDKAGILEPPKQSVEENRYPSLKWGLVALMSGLAFILIEVLRNVNPKLISYNHIEMAVGILLVFISLGFLIYFFIMNQKKS